MEVLNMSKGIINGFDITKYATDPTHETKIASMTEFARHTIGSTDANDIDKYITKRAPRSPLTGLMFILAARKYNLGDDGLFLMIALIQNDSMFGTVGKGAITCNPGNVGNDDAGNIQYFDTWQDGLNAVAEWLNRHRVTIPEKSILERVLEAMKKEGFSQEEISSVNESLQKGSWPLPRMACICGCSLFFCVDQHSLQCALCKKKTTLILKYE
jgi:hypothetical protein